MSVEKKTRNENVCKDYLRLKRGSLRSRLRKIGEDYGLDWTTVQKILIRRGILGPKSA